MGQQSCPILPDSRYMVVAVSITNDSFRGVLPVFSLDKFFEFNPIKNFKAHRFNESGGLLGKVMVAGPNLAESSISLILCFMFFVETTKLHIYAYAHSSDGSNRD